MTALPFQREDVERSIPGSYLQRAEEYLEKGHVFELRDAERNRLQAKVQGSRGQPYAVDVRLVPGRTGMQIYGLCSCPVRINCKHVAAVLLQALANGTRKQPRPAALARSALPAVRPDAAPRTAKKPLPVELELWLSQTQRIAEGPASRPEVPARVTQCLLYTLHIPDPPQAAHTHVRIALARRLKGGGYAGVTSWNNARQAISHPPSFVLPEDQRLLRWLLIDAAVSLEDGFVLAGETAPQLLRAMLATGRCHFDDHAQPLRQGEPRDGRLLWRLLSDGLQQIACETEPPSQRLLAMSPPWYVDLERLECGPLETQLSSELAAALVAAPAVAPEDVAEVRRSLIESVPGTESILPQPLRETELHGTPPVPCLQLVTLQALGRGYRPLRRFLEIAVPHFEYAGVRVNRDSPRKIRAFRDGVLVTIERDARSEKRFYETLKAVGLVPLREATHEYPYEHERDYALRDPRGWPDFVFGVLPRLRGEGWRVDLDDSFRFKPVEHGTWVADVEDAGRDWFDLSLGLELEGKRLDVLPLLMQALRARPELMSGAAPVKAADSAALYVRMDDGRLLPVPVERVRPILSILHEMLDTHVTGALRLPRSDAVRLADLERETGLQWRGGENLRQFGRRLADFTGIESVDPPRGLSAQLRPYQLQGLAWLQFLRRYELGGILADDMGLGKTMQALAHILVEKEAGRLDRPALVVTPTSVVPNWKAEAARFAPGLTVHVSHGFKRREGFERLSRADLVLTTYPLLARDREALTAQEFHLIVLDEAQQIKNAKTQGARVVGQLRARHRLCLTGTSLENHLGELWSLFHFLMPGFLSDADTFRRLYRTPIEKRGDELRRVSLARRIRPFLLRRTKEQVAAELPLKTDIVHAVELSGAQRDLYEAVRASMHERVRAEIAARGLKQSHIVVLDALLKLRQVCCDPRLLKLDAAKKVTESAKLEALLDMLQELLPEGRRVLLFSQFTSMLELIEVELKRLDIRYVKLTGDTRDRKKPVEAFQSGKVPLFLISLKAGGTGLNLTAADTVIHYDPWWNPAVERQATDRAHRIGQDKPVFAYKLIVLGSVEEKIARLQASKAALAAGVLGEGGAADVALAAEDIAALFEPLT